MARRPRLKSHARPLRRTARSLQLGLATDTGVVLDGLTKAEMALLERLDGSHDLTSLYAVASTAGVAASRVTMLLEVLRQRHLILDSPTDRAALTGLDEPWRDALRPDADALAAAYRLAGDGYATLIARRRQHVVVSGEGGLPFALGALLRAGGVGRVEIGDHAADTLDLDLRHDARSLMPDLVVLAAVGAVRSEAGEPWRRRGVPILPLVTQGHRVVVGPLLDGGDGPCLRCLDLHRCDRDAAWPGLLAQLAPRRPVGPMPQINAESTLTAIAAGLASMVIHTRLDGQQVPTDLSLEVCLPWPRIDHRQWPAHPLCHCLRSRVTMSR